MAVKPVPVLCGGLGWCVLHTEGTASDGWLFAVVFAALCWGCGWHPEIMHRLCTFSQVIHTYARHRPDLHTGCQSYIRLKSVDG